MGRTAGAARLLQAARAAVRDTSPLPCAWIDYQEAALAERLGDRMRARALYERAHALLPRYAAAAAHLAAYLDPADSVPMLEKIAERSAHAVMPAALASPWPPPRAGTTS
jgi:hypothetical protein